jgi:DNA polymerase III alpha subunit
MYLKETLIRKMIEDRYGRIALEQDDIIDVMMTDPDVTIKRALVKDCDLTHVQELLDEVYDFQQYSNLDIPVSEFDAQNQVNWHMPDEYKDLDIAKWLIEQCKTQPELQRVGEELLLFQERDLFDLLKYLKYLVDTMRQHQVIWGVGRGSSVASYVLYLIGIHKVDSMYYDLPITEFLR